MAALERCGLRGRESDFIWQLSGGQTHLLALAGALSLQPDVLILDEPIAQLDPAHADRIYGVLRELNERYGKTIIVIEHHTEYIARLLQARHAAERGPGAVDAAHRRGSAASGRTAKLQYFPAAGDPCGLADAPGGQPDRAAPAGDHLRGQGSVCPPGRPGARPAACRPCAGETVASFQDVSVAYRSVKGEPHKVFDGLSLAIHKGDKVALIGSNGAGKSTFMKLLVGLMKPSTGTVCLHGRSLRDVRPEALSREVSMVYQNPEDMFIKDSIEKDIAYAMEARGVPDAAGRTDRLLERFRLSGLRDRDGRLLSGGQMRRASLAIGVALDPGILLLDEPTANLDIATRKEIMRTLEDLKEITETVVIATHDMQLVCEWAQRIIVLCGGKVVADGTRDEIFGDRALIERVGIRPPEIFAMGQALDPAALCYTIDDFLRCFEGRKPV